MLESAFLELNYNLWSPFWVTVSRGTDSTAKIKHPSLCKK